MLKKLLLVFAMVHFVDSKLKILEFANKYNTTFVNMTTNVKEKNDDVVSNIYFKMMVEIPVIVVKSDVIF